MASLLLLFLLQVGVVLQVEPWEVLQLQVGVVLQVEPWEVLQLQVGVVLHVEPWEVLQLQVGVVLQVEAREVLQLQVALWVQVEAHVQLLVLGPWLQLGRVLQPPFALGRLPWWLWLKKIINLPKLNRTYENNCNT